MKSFRAIAAALALSLSLGLAGAARAEDIVVTHYASLLYGTPYAVALDKGFFKQAGVDVSSILTSKGGGTSVRNMMAGETLFAEVAFPAALSALKEGFPIKIISGGTAGPSSFWVTRPDVKIDTPEDLKGKRFVYSRPKSVSESSIFAVLKSHGLKPSDVQMIAIGDFGAGLTALEHNKIDIAIIPKPIYSQKMKAGAKYKIIPWLDSKLPPYTQTVGIATNDMIAKKGAQLAAVIEGRRKGTDVLYSDQKATAAALAKAYNLPPDIAASALAGILKQTPTWWSRGALDIKQMELSAQSLKDTGAFEGDVDWKAAIDDRFIPKDLQSKTQ